MELRSPGLTVLQHNTSECYIVYITNIVRYSQTDWNDGRTLCEIVRNLGGPAPSYDKLDMDRTSWEHNLQMGKILILCIF